MCCCVVGGLGLYKRRIEAYPPPEAYLGVSDKRDSHRQPALHTSRVGFNPLVTHTAIVEVDSLQSSVHCGLQVFTLQLFQATVE